MDFLYVDCFSGISGDMMLGGLLDLGVSFDILQDAIASMHIDAKLNCTKKILQGISCSAFTVSCPESPPLRHLPQIQEIIDASPLSDQVKNASLTVFKKLAEAEAKVHDIDPDKVHFHEIGAVDTLVDIVGTFICLQELGITQVYSSPVPWSEGLISISHGQYPLPAPATANLLLGFPCVHCTAGMELVTPTGAALLTYLASGNTEVPAFIPVSIGYGAGTRVRNDGVPNLLRVIRAQQQSDSAKTETIAIIETELDDMNPEFYSHLYKLFINRPEVYDFFTTPIYMKKNRPGILITILAKPDHIKELADLLMRETGTLGVRYRLQERFLLPRSMDVIDTPWGPVRIKIAQYNNGELHKKPEFDDCQSIAVKNGLPLLKVYNYIQSLLVDK